MELNNTISETEHLLEGLGSRFEEAEEPANMMIMRWKLSSWWSIKKKNKEKRHVRQHPENQHMHYGSSEGEVREKEQKKFFEGIMAPNFPI